MATYDDSESLAGVTVAPTEPVLTKSVDWTMCINVSFDCSKSALSIKSTFYELFSDRFTGMGKVDLVKVDLVYATRAAGQSVLCGFANANGNLSTSTVAGMPGGYFHVSNAFNTGIKSTVNLIPPGIYSRQIQPASSSLPTLKLYLSADKNVQLNLHVYLKHFGPMIVNLEKDASSF